MFIGFFTTNYFPYILAMALNRTHGVGNNTEGKLFIPLGIIFLFVLLVANIFLVLFNLGIIKSSHINTNKKIFLTVWMIGLVLGYVNQSVIIGNWIYLSGIFS